MEVKGLPPRSMIMAASRRKFFFDDDYNPLVNPNSKGKIRKPNTKTLENLLKTDDDQFLDFIDKCFEWKVEKRLKPEEAF